MPPGPGWSLEVGRLLVGARRVVEVGFGPQAVSRTIVYVSGSGGALQNSDLVQLRLHRDSALEVLRGHHLHGIPNETQRRDQRLCNRQEGRTGHLEKRRELGKHLSAVLSKYDAVIFAHAYLEVLQPNGSHSGQGAEWLEVQTLER